MYGLGARTRGSRLESVGGSHLEGVARTLAGWVPEPVGRSRLKGARITPWVPVPVRGRKIYALSARTLGGRELNVFNFYEFIGSVALRGWLLVRNCDPKDI